MMRHVHLESTVCAREYIKNAYDIKSWTVFPLSNIVMPEMIKFHPYSIFNSETMVGSVIYCV